MAEPVNHVIGVMDPNSLSFRYSLEGLLDHLKPAIDYKGKKHTISHRRIICRPYDTLEAKSTCDVIINRGAHWNPHHNSFFAIVMHYVYLLNDMISFKAIDKNTGYGQMFELGMKIPATWAIPPKDNTELRKSKTIDPDLVFNEYELFSLQEIGEAVGFPAFLKPQDGGGWIGVVKVDDQAALQKAYDESGEKPMNLQKAIDYRQFVRTVGVGPQMMPMHYNASAEYPHDRYMWNAHQAVAFNWLSPEEHWEVSALCKIINAFYGWDHNSCEALIGKDDSIYPIDFCNAYPDSMLPSLHFYFPDLVKAMVKWLIYVAVTDKKKRIDFAYHWPRFFEIKEKAAKEGWSYTEKLKAYEKIADEHFETEKFHEFYAKNYPDFDQKALEYFESDAFVDTVLVPDLERHFKIPQERPPKVVHYTGIHKFWCHCERQRLAAKTPPAPETPSPEAAAGKGAKKPGKGSGARA